MANEFSERQVEVRESISDAKVYEAAICFARMWGVMETLEPFPNLGFEGVRNIAITLAEEYVSGDGKDIEGLFIERLDLFKEKYGLRTTQ